MLTQTQQQFTYFFCLKQVSKAYHEDNALNKPLYSIHVVLLLY